MVGLIKRALVELLIYNSVVCLISHVKLHNKGIIAVLAFANTGLFKTLFSSGIRNCLHQQNI